ncbi:MULTISPECIES: alpha/beta hydrolase [unclassified Bradyrhizobium]|uniref:alpha/beta hydrolase n=1 Tax=unclassified Bradyrhizobium TaxID=2631580 RepID=UPI0020B3F1A2|nr:MULTISPECIES: alpha/beta hydrolase [unclassified Bradyrhizobium]MCP3380647.1 alpha/beta hydrolase [Bradyrhizobium sp. CCGUVB4N]MCP3441517.1 alpha/beta hydrolase [Bradyrhizobium sp. CCGUVB14]
MSRKQLDAILQMSAQFPPPANGSPADMRAWFEAINAQTPIPDGAMIERVSSGPVGGDLIRYPNSDGKRLIVYFHGGGFFFGSSRSHRVVAANLARASGFSVLAADYRLAPEHPAPTAHDDALVVYQWALAHGFAPSAVCLSGDSAGGNLTIATAMRARDEGLPMPGALVVMSPALDFTGQSESFRTVADAPLLTPQLTELFKQVYFGASLPTSPYLAPLNGDLSQLPATLIHVGSWELLRDDSVQLAGRLRQAGGSAELKIWDVMCHSWQLFAPMLDEGMASIEEAAVFARGRLAP